MTIDDAAAAAGFAGLVGLALDGATPVCVESSFCKVSNSAAYAHRRAAAPRADFGRGVEAALWAAAAAAERGLPWARLFEVRASSEAPAAPAAAAAAAAVARFHALGGGGICLAGPAGGGAQAEAQADLAAARLHAPDTAGFPGRDVAAAAAAAAAAADEAARFHRELSVSRRGEAAGVAAEEAAARFHRELSVSRRGAAAGAAGVEAEEAAARFHRELSVSRRGDASAAAGVEAAGAAGAPAEVAAEAEAEAALFQGLLCTLVDVRTGVGSPAVGRRTGWRVGRGEAAAAAALTDVVETEAVATDAVHLQPALCALADVRAAGAGSGAAGSVVGRGLGRGAEGAGPIVSAAAGGQGTCEGATGWSAGGRTRLLGRRATRIVHPTLSLYGSNEAHVR